MKRTVKLRGAGLLAAAAFMGVWIVGEHDSAASDPAMNGREAPAEPARPMQPIAGLGIVEPASGTIELASELPGVIVALNVAEGDRIERGEIVAELSNDDLKAKVAQAAAQLQIRRADLLRIENGSRQQEVAQAENRVAELKADLDMVDGDLARAEQLRRSGAISKKALQAAKNAATVARNQLDAAEEALSLVREGARVEEIAAARAEVELAVEQLAEAEAFLAKSFIRASTDGTVLRLLREVGEAVSTQPATAVAEIGDTSALVVRAQIDEAEIGGLAVGQSAEISAPAFGDHRLKGKVVRISPRIGTKIVNADTADEKRDARVLDVIVALDPGIEIPVNLRVDVFIDPSSRVADATDPSGSPLPDWVIRK